MFFILIWRFHSELCRIEDLPLSLHPQYPIQSLHTHQHRSLWPTKPLLPNDNCPAAPNGKDGASIPQLPGISNLQTPAQTLTPERLAPSFGSVVVKTVAHHLFKNSRFTTNLVQTDPAMTAPTFSNPEGPSGFDPELQAKFPEAYAFAVRVDQFGKNQIALLKVTMQPPKPSLFKEFAWLGRLLKKGTGHDLYTPGVHTEGFQPVAIKVEAMVLEAAQSTKRFALQRLNNPIQADIDVTLGVLRGAGELAKGVFDFLLDTNNPDDVISRDLLNTLDVLASNIDIQYLCNPSGATKQCCGGIF